MPPPRTQHATRNTQHATRSNDHDRAISITDFLWHCGMTLPRPNYFGRRLRERIDIPRDAKSLPLRLLTISVRLKHMLESAGFTKLGEIHGRDISSFAKYRNFRPKTRAELRKMVHQVQVNARNGDLAEMRDPN